MTILQLVDPEPTPTEELLALARSLVDLRVQQIDRLEAALICARADWDAAAEHARGAEARYEALVAELRVAIATISITPRAMPLFAMDGDKLQRTWLTAIAEQLIERKLTSIDPARDAWTDIPSQVRMRVEKVVGLPKALKDYTPEQVSTHAIPVVMGIEDELKHRHGEAYTHSYYYDKTQARLEAAWSTPTP